MFHKKLICLAILCGSFIYNAHACEQPEQTEPQLPKSLYRMALDTPEQIKESEYRQKTFIHQLLYEHYTLESDQIRPCLSITWFLDQVKSVDMKTTLEAKIFFLIHGQDLLKPLWTNFHLQAFYQKIESLSEVQEIKLPSYIAAQSGQIAGGYSHSKEAVTTRIKEIFNDVTAFDLFLCGLYQKIDGLVSRSADPLKAKQFFEASTDLGLCPMASFELGRICEFGLGGHVQPDFRMAKKYYLASCPDADPRAAFALSQIVAREGNLDEAFTRALKVAKQGHGPAQYYVGRCYHKELGVSQKDFDQARQWYRHAVDRGNVLAEIHYGKFLWKGLGGSKNISKAFEIMDRISKQHEHPRAIHYLARFYQDGVHVERDNDKAKELFETAANLGQPQSWNFLGVYFYKGEAKVNAYKKSIELYQKQKNKLFRLPIGNLAGHYLDNFEVGSAQFKEAERLLKQVLSYPKAQRLLGNLEKERKDIPQAKMYYQRAATLGDAWGMYHLAKLSKNRKIAWKWLYLLALKKNETFQEDLQKNFHKEFFLHYLPCSQKIQKVPVLEQAWRESFESLKKAAEGSSIAHLLAPLKLPMHLYKHPGFLITNVRVQNNRGYPTSVIKEAGYMSVPIGAQYYLIFGHEAVQDYRDYMGQLDAIEEKLNSALSLESSLTEESTQKYQAVKKCLAQFIHAQNKYIKGTLPQRNTLFSNTFDDIFWCLTKNNRPGTGSKKTSYLKKETPFQKLTKKQFRQHFSLDEHLLTIPAQKSSGLKENLDESWKNLVGVSKGTPLAQFVLDIAPPFAAFNQAGFLITIARVKEFAPYIKQDSKDAECLKVDLGSQYYLIFGNKFVQGYARFQSSVEKLENRLKEIMAHKSEIKKEDAGKYDDISNNIVKFNSVWKKHIKGTLAERNIKFAKTYSNAFDAKV